MIILKIQKYKKNLLFKKNFSVYNYKNVYLTNLYKSKSFIIINNINNIIPYNLYKLISKTQIYLKNYYTLNKYNFILNINFYIYY